MPPFKLEEVRSAVRQALESRTRTQNIRGSVLCFAGSPDTGKTSMGKAIANALGRKFARISLGGLKDEAEIRGHRRTYVGAKPGRIIEEIRRAESKRMGMLVDDLLDYTSKKRTEKQFMEVNLNSLVREAVNDLRDELKERDIRWEIDKLPEVYGDQSMLKLVLVNLISNAVKFTRTRHPTEIRIGCKEDRDDVACSIKDNGVGFDMKYADKLFNVFHRLHHRDEFEGTGIGLAKVRRIISRHGGKTWAEGTIGQGATFYFTLPKHKET